MSKIDKKIKSSHLMENFGSYIRELRKQEKWTLTKLAAMLDMDSANLCKIENGKRNFDEKKLPKLCSIFQLDFDKMKNELLSEKFAQKAYLEDLDVKVFKLAEQKIKYLKKQ